jgi:hypothetical protein
MEFKEFNRAIQKQFYKMQKTGKLFTVDIDKDELWRQYLGSFPIGTDPMLFEATQHSCSSCRKFIKAIAGCVVIENNKLVTIWDIKAENEYKTVAKIMKKLVKSKDIKNKFLIRPNLTSNQIVGGLPNTVKPDNTTLFRDKIGMTFTHFNVKVDKEFIKEDSLTTLAKIEGKFISHKRSCNEIPMASVEIVKDLIAGDLYRGAEMLPVVEQFKQLLQGYTEAEDKDTYLWSVLDTQGKPIRTTVIGTLLLDVGTGDLEVAVKKYESKVSAGSYKRTNAVVTPRMREQHLKIIRDEGIEDSLYKRYATLSDVSVNDVLFVDASVSDKMQDGIAGLMAQGTTSKPSLGKTRATVSLEDFIANIVPKASSIKMLVENKHQGNLVSLISPKVADAPNIQQWSNNSSWAYNGGVTDSMKERVKEAGGDVNGILRFSIQWNEDNQDQRNDLDAHCIEPSGGCHIFFGRRSCKKSTGNLDVDITSPGNEIAVENITYQSTQSMLEGEYEFYVKNYSGRNVNGFRAEIEMDGIIHSFDYANPVTSDVLVGTVTLKDGKFTLKTDLQTSTSSKNVWGIKTQELVKVDSIMYSPNYWQDNSIGLKHTFFMLEGCNSNESVRGLYNEHLSSKYRDIRKSVDMLAPMLQCAPVDHPLSGLGFGSRKDEFTVVVRGKEVSGTYIVQV